MKQIPVDYDPFVNDPNNIPQLKWAAGQGRKGDSLIVHTTPGDVVIPVERIDQATNTLLSNVLGPDLARYTVGTQSNVFNPATSLREFEGDNSGDNGGNNGGGNGDNGNGNNSNDGGSGDRGGGAYDNTGGVGGSGLSEASFGGTSLDPNSSNNPDPTNSGDFSSASPVTSDSLLGGWSDAGADVTPGDTTVPEQDKIDAAKAGTVTTDYNLDGPGTVTTTEGVTSDAPTVNLGTSLTDLPGDYPSLDIGNPTLAATDPEAFNNSIVGFTDPGPQAHHFDSGGAPISDAQWDAQQQQALAAQTEQPTDTSLMGPPDNLFGGNVTLSGTDSPVTNPDVGYFMDPTNQQDTNALTDMLGTGLNNPNTGFGASPGSWTGNTGISLASDTDPETAASLGFEQYGPGTAPLTAYGTQQPPSIDISQLVSDPSKIDTSQAQQGNVGGVQAGTANGSTNSTSNSTASDSSSSTQDNNPNSGNQTSAATSSPNSSMPAPDMSGIIGNTNSTSSSSNTSNPSSNPTNSNPPVDVNPYNSNPTGPSVPDPTGVVSAPNVPNLPNVNVVNPTGNIVTTGGPSSDPNAVNPTPSGYTAPAPTPDNPVTPQTITNLITAPSTPNIPAAPTAPPAPTPITINSGTQFPTIPGTPTTPGSYTPPQSGSGSSVTPETISNLLTPAAPSTPAAPTTPAAPVIRTIGGPGDGNPGISQPNPTPSDNPGSGVSNPVTPEVASGLLSGPVSTNIPSAPNVPTPGVTRTIGGPGDGNPGISNPNPDPTGTGTGTSGTGVTPAAIGDLLSPYTGPGNGDAPAPLGLPGGQGTRTKGSGSGTGSGDPTGTGTTGTGTGTTTIGGPEPVAPPTPTLSEPASTNPNTPEPISPTPTPAEPTSNPAPTTLTPPVTSVTPPDTPVTATPQAPNYPGQVNGQPAPWGADEDIKNRVTNETAAGITAANADPNETESGKPAPLTGFRDPANSGGPNKEGGVVGAVKGAVSGFFDKPVKSIANLLFGMIPGMQIPAMANSAIGGVNKVAGTNIPTIGDLAQAGTDYLAEHGDTTPASPTQVADQAQGGGDNTVIVPPIPSQYSRPFNIMAKPAANPVAAVTAPSVTEIKNAPEEENPVHSLQSFISSNPIDVNSLLSSKQWV